jgi:hypothetical protein
MSDITVKVGNVVLNASNSDLVSVDETPDGVSFSFKGGVQLLFTDPYMPSSAKQIVKNTADNMAGKKLVFELDNPKRPAMVDAT